MGQNLTWSDIKNVVTLCFAGALVYACHDSALFSAPTAASKSISAAEISAAPSPPQPLDEVRAPVQKAAREALEAFYVGKKIYSPVRCNGIMQGEYYFVRCHPFPNDGSVPGGLYAIKGKVLPDAEIWAVNGKAQQHAVGRSVKLENGTEVMIQRMLAKPDINITALLSAIP